MKTLTRADFPHFLAIPTRWMDNDIYGHVNNVVYYSYFSPLAFPDLVHAGLRVARLGHSSVRYEVGLFKNDEQTVSAAGHFIHVYVNRAARRPVPLPERLREVLQTIAYIPA
ncbi:MAG: acyl-CoA thioesterase [Betaproteobacteria bacterium]|nr:acyl-CoA thioesterase [Betaproteobacteria bacterium]